MWTFENFKMDTIKTILYFAHQLSFYRLPAHHKTLVDISELTWHIFPVTVLHLTLYKLCSNQIKHPTTCSRYMVHFQHMCIYADHCSGDYDWPRCKVKI